MLAYFDTNLGWGELLKRTAKETKADNGLGLAAQLAYYFFLALFPTLLFLIALAGAVASEGLVTRVVDMLGGAAPPDVVNIIRDQLSRLSQGNQGGIMTFGVVAALWSSSAAMVALIDSLNRAYDVEDARPWWKQRLIAILLTVGVAIFILASFALVVFGPQLAASIAGRVGLGAVFEWTWNILQWPIVFGLVTTAFGLIYYFAPDVDQDFVFLTPGSVLATTLWLIGSLAFRFYVVNFGSYNQMYGTIGGIMVLLLWLYISGLCGIIGAEMDAEIEHASDHGKAAGEKTPGQRKTIGARAARQFRGRQAHPARVPARAAAGEVQTPRVSPAAYARTSVLFGACSCGNVSQTGEGLGKGTDWPVPLRVTLMDKYDTSVIDMVKTAVRDAQDLVRGEIALAKAEAREEIRRLGAGAALLAGAAVAGVVGLVFLLTTIAWALSEGLEWPVWAGFAVVTALTLIVAATMASLGRARLARARHMPRTVDTLKENMQWMRARTS